MGRNIKRLLKKDWSKEKPNFEDDYVVWLKDIHKIEINDQIKHKYITNARIIHNDFSESLFWKELMKSKAAIEQEYFSENHYFLFSQVTEAIEIKPYDSLLMKSFRKNILLNDNYPETPSGGWILPDNWFEHINDIVRTLFVCKYLDGVEFLTEKLVDLCNVHSLYCEKEYKAEDKGYYAVHVNIREDFGLVDNNWMPKKTKCCIEIQISTQIQEVIRKLLHKHYENKRMMNIDDRSKWQWDFRNEDFSANYIGHILHYLEGVIMDVRENKGGSKK